MYSKLIIFILILILFTYIFIVTKKCTSTEIYIYDSHNPGPTILVVAGTHGNEPAASIYFTDLIKNNKIKIKSGKLIIIPRVNSCALKMNLRSTPLIGDINRKYELVDGKINKVNGEINKVNGQTNGINKQIIEIIKMNKIDFVLDFHEGYDFHKINESSLGTTITYTNDKTGKAEEIGEKIIDRLNETIIDKRKHFELLDFNYKPIDGTLLEYLSGLNISGILIETSGQNNIQPLNVRIKQIEFIFNSIIYLYHL